MALENNFVAAELAEFNPLRDPHGLTCTAATRLLTSLFAPRQAA
jgi:arginase family enzyme